MSSVLNAAPHAAGSAKSPEKSTISGRHGQPGAEAAGEFASLFGVMMEAGLRQDFAAPAAADGKSSPVAGLAAEVLGPTVHIITTAEPATSDESLLAFARAQGMDEQSLALIFGQPGTPAAAGPALPPLPGDGLATSPDGKPGMSSAGALAADAAATALAATASAAADAAAADGDAPMNQLDLGPDATLRWSVGDAKPPAAREALLPMFGLNGLRAMLPAPPASPPAPATPEVAAHPEAANQSLAASLLLGAAEAGQAARKLQAKQAGQRGERLAELSAARLAPAGTAAIAGIGDGLSAADADPSIDTLTLDTGLDDADLQALLQQRPADARQADSGNANAGHASATGAERTTIELRTEQYEKLSQRLGEALGQRLAAQIAKGDWKVEMALRPHDLGNIEIELAMKNGGLEASFNASEMRTRDLIADGLPRLKEVLAQLGMDVASVNVNVRQNGQHGGNPTPGRQSAGGVGTVGKLARAGDAGIPAAPPARPAPAADDGLDVLV